MVKVTLQNLDRPRISIAIEGLDSTAELKGVEQYRHFGRLMKFLTLASEIKTGDKKIYVNTNSFVRYLLEKKGESVPVSSRAIKQLLSNKKLNFKKIDKSGLEQICNEVFKAKLIVVPVVSDTTPQSPIEQVNVEPLKAQPADLPVPSVDTSIQVGPFESPEVPQTPSRTKTLFFERVNPANLAIKTQAALEALEKIINELGTKELPENEFTKWDKPLVMYSSQTIKCDFENLNNALKGTPNENKAKSNLISLYSHQNTIQEFLKKYDELLAKAGPDIKPLYEARFELFKKVESLINPLLEVDSPEDIGNIDQSPLSNVATLQKLHELKLAGVKRGIILGRPYFQNLPNKDGWKWCGLDAEPQRYHPDGVDQERLQLTMLFEDLDAAAEMKMLFNEVVIDFSTIKFFDDHIEGIIRSMIRLLEPGPETTLIFEFDQKFESEHAYHLLRQMGFSEVQLNETVNFPYRQEFGMGEYKGFIQAKGLRPQGKLMEVANLSGVEMRVKQALKVMKEQFSKLEASSPPDFQWRNKSLDEALKDYMSQKINVFEKVFGWLYDTKDHESDPQTAIENHCKPVHIEFLNNLMTDYQTKIERSETTPELRAAYEQRLEIYREILAQVGKLADELNIIIVV